MKRRLFSLAGLALAGAGLANMNQIDPVDQLDLTPTFTNIQIFPDKPAYNSTVVEDFVTLGTVTSVSLAFELDDESVFATLPDVVVGWRISLWASPQDASNSGNSLTGNALASVFVPGNSPQITYSVIGPGVFTPFYRVDITGLQLVTAPGLVWIGAAAEMDSGDGEIFILSNLDPVDRGGGAPNNSRGVNPGNGFGMGRLVNGPFSDAAYAVTSVPEPATLLALGAGLGALALRRRRR